jgi:antitoxin component YwqK of YwqJK toxin-antitoxin module
MKWCYQFYPVFKDDKLEGKHWAFFESGHRFQVLNYQNGYEDGKQKTWNDSGREVNNFTAKRKALWNYRKVRHVGYGQRTNQEVVNKYYWLF